MAENENVSPEDDLFLPPEEAGDEQQSSDLDPEEEELERTIDATGDLGAQMVETIAELEQKLEAATDDAREWKDRAIRTAADFDNARKRFQREREDVQVLAKESLLREVLPVLDDLERALLHVGGGLPDDAPLLEGVRMVHRKFIGTLDRLGCAAIEAMGQVFDPNLHEALQQIERDDIPDQTIVEEFQKGYLYQGRLVRPSMVVVGRNSKPAPKAEPAEANGADGSEAAEGGGDD